MIKMSLKSGLMIAVCFAFFTLSACTQSAPQAKRPTTTRSLKKYSNLDSASQTRWQPNPHDTIPFVMNEPVKKMVGKFSNEWKSSFDKWIYRIGVYGPTIEKVLREEGVPPDLIYLSMIESGFNLGARSHASAVGPWQFIQSTGRMYGLKNDLFMDDRSDLIVATRAAARHLRDLYNEFNDWYLAFAAYNAGSGGVNRVARKSGSRDFWKMSKTKFMHPETKEYVPKILAAMHIVKNYKQFGYTEKDFGMPLQYEVATVNDATDMKFVSNATHTPIETLHQLNPQIPSGVTRPNSNSLVYLPRGKKNLFEQEYTSTPAQKRVSHLSHPVQGSETLKSISAYYEIDVNQLAKYNNLGVNSDLKPGQSIKIPASPSLLLALSEKPLSSAKSSSSAKVVYHKVKKGETLPKVASKYGVSTAQLQKWNKLGKKSSLRAGQNLKIVRKSGATVAKSSSRPFYAEGFAGRSWSAPTRDSSGALLAKDDGSTANESTPSPVEINRDEEDEAIDMSSGLSGVAHLIFLEDQNADSEFNTMESEDALAEEETQQNTNNVDITKVSATESDADTSIQDAETPGFVKTPQEEIVSTPAKPAVSQPKNQVHTVKSGESLTSIAKKYNLSITQLKQFNSLNSNTVKIGQKLKINAKSPVNTNKKSQSSFLVHTTRSGENLWNIANRYNVKVADIKKWNSLNSDTLRANQKIKIIAEK